ncbi:helix-turn-helix domain-containing protein [Tychonema sp. BBK16]|uniref:helix-turn-helix transcriptional regulator n=1 Tax=Tychonema sp. BBK16 TaxID=2699888 RepID=UPI001F3DF422|nr:helix-turn-helix domain-containing protein [Tychonema sp. BBK16]MCF6372837.1 helix-turn-helix domain-containing protein [Tychonema sp. BBK16]
MPPTNEQFTQAANHWDLEALYIDLASTKGKRLTPVEKLHLRGLLCGYSPAEVADKLHKSVKGVESEMCTTLYPHIKSLVGKSNEKVENWRNITEWLEEAGYKTQLLTESQFNNCVPVDIMGKIAHISIKKNRITIEIDLQLSDQLPSQLPTEDLNNNNHTNN